MRLNMALPCRISVYTEKDITKIGPIKPAQMLSALSQDAALGQIAQEVEEKTIQMVDEVKCLFRVFPTPRCQAGVQRTSQGGDQAAHRNGAIFDLHDMRNIGG